MGGERRDGADANIGSTVAHFEVEAELGRGGMGVVYAARDVNLRRRVALKLLPAEAVGDRTRRARFLREARSAAAVSHANVAIVYEVGESGDAVYIAMELVDGESLQQLLDRERPALAHSVALALQIAHALDAAHTAGVIHRDLKPANVMLASGGVIKLLDFGLAKSIDPPSGLDSTAAAVTGERALIGTPAYMSPEQCRGQTADHRSDVFSFGTLVYELVTGRRPFVADSYPELGVAIMRDTPPPIAELVPGVPPALSRIVERCLRKQPDRRFQSFAEVIGALEQVSFEPSSEVTVTDAGTRSNDHVATVPAHRRGVWLGGAAALLVAAAAVWLLWPVNAQLAPGSSPSPAVTRGTNAGAGRSSRPWREQPLTAFDGRVLPDSLALSRDGKQLAYWADKLWVRDIDRKRNRAVEVRGEPERVEPMDFFADGKRLLARIVDDKHDGLEIVDLRDGSHRLWKADSGYGRLSPDGRRIAYLRSDRLFVAPLSGQGKRLASFDTGVYLLQIAWSPDGTALALLIAQSGDNRIEILSADGSTSTRIVSHVKMWNLAGGVDFVGADELVYAKAYGYGSRLCRVAIAADADGKRLNRCIHDWSGGWLDDLHVGGNRLVYRKRKESMDVATAAIDGRGRVLGPLVALPEQQGRNNCEGWTTDDRLLSRSRRPDGSVVVAQRPKGSPVVLASHAGFPVQAGGDIIVTRGVKRAGHGEICQLVRLRNGREHVIRSVPGSAESLCPRLRCTRPPMVRCVLVPFGGRVSFQRFDPATGHTVGRKHERPGRHNSFVNISADGNKMVWANLERGFIATMVVDSGDYREIRPKGGLRAHDISWLPDNHSWLVAGYYPGHRRGGVIARVKPDGSYEVVLHDKRAFFHNPLLSPDGHTLAVTVERRDYDVFMMEGL